jgi:hypothetical protein
MLIFCHEDIEKDLRQLKHCAAPRESLEAWERLFELKGLKRLQVLINILVLVY